MSETASQAHTPRPVLTPIQRLHALYDPGSLHVIRGETSMGSLGSWRREDRVITASGTVAGRPIYSYAQDRSVGRGALGEAQAREILHVMSLAGEARVPIVGFIDSAGARIQEGPRALAAYGRIFRMNVALSQRVPQISVVCGLAAGGACYSPALMDLVVMTAASRMFLTGPEVVREMTGEQVTAHQLGGVAVHERNGACDLVAEDDAAAAVVVRQLLSFLPQNASEAPNRDAPRDPVGSDLASWVPREPSCVYDVRDVIARVVDAGTFLELSPRWSKNLVTGLARLDGWAVGVIANQPRHLGGVIDVGASQKGTRFVERCAAFGLPLIVFVDTPGFMPGTRQEGNAIIHHGAMFLRAFAQANVGKATVVLRKAYGGGLIAMNSKDLGADFVFAWPHATMGVLGARTAVNIIHRREISAAESPADELRRRAAIYAAEHEGADVVADTGVVDEIILPRSTRARLAGALETLALADKRTTDIDASVIPV